MHCHHPWRYHLCSMGAAPSAWLPTDQRHPPPPSPFGTQTTMPGSLWYRLSSAYAPVTHPVAVPSAPAPAPIVCASQVSKSKLAAPADDGGDGGGAASEEAASARGRLVGTLMKKHMMEAVVPVMVELKVRRMPGGGLGQGAKSSAGCVNPRAFGIVVGTGELVRGHTVHVQQHMADERC